MKNEKNKEVEGREIYVYWNALPGLTHASDEAL
jgi:hypothetical protein